MALLWTDGTWTTESAVSGFSYEAPIPRDSTPYIRKQDFVVQASSYSPPAFSAVSDTSWRFVGDSGFSDLGGGMMRFTRTWVNGLLATPADPFITHTEWETYAYNFIGYYGMTGINVAYVTGRSRRTRTVLSKIVHNYYLCTSGQTYTTPGALSAIINRATQYYYGTVDTPVDYLTDSPFAPTTTPSKATYQTWVADAVSNKWAATTGILTAEDSRIERWMGDFYVMKTRYVLAE